MTEREWWTSDSYATTAMIFIQMTGDQLLGSPSPVFSPNEADLLYNDVMQRLPSFAEYYKAKRGEALTREAVWMRYRRAYTFHIHGDVDADIADCKRRAELTQPVGG